MGIEDIAINESEIEPKEIRKLLIPAEIKEQMLHDKELREENFYTPQNI